MKFNQYTWNLYKQSSDGQKAIKEFEEANEKMTEYELFSKYNPNSAHFLSEDYFRNMRPILGLLFRQCRKA